MEQNRGFELNGFIASGEEMRDFVSNIDREDFIVCPRPRRAGLSFPIYSRPLRCNTVHMTESRYSDAGVELLDLILTKEDYVTESHHASETALSAPFFSGSPPSRIGNPLSQDARFRDEGFTPIPAISGASPSGLHPPLSSAHRALVSKPVRAKPAHAVRMEGFDILGRESRNSNPPAPTRVEGFDILNRDSMNPGLPATIRRVEGFHILGRDRRNSSVSAAA